MACVGHGEQPPEGAAAPPAHLDERMRRSKPVRRAVERVLRLGAHSGLPVDAAKRLRLCNVNALGGSIIMATWAAVEAVMGDRGNLLWELRFLAGFLAVLGLSALGAHRVARLLLIVTANICVFAGALLFHRTLRRDSPLLRDGGHAAPAVWARRMVAGGAGGGAPRAPVDRCQDRPGRASVLRPPDAGAPLVLRGQRRDHVRARLLGAVLLLSLEREGGGVVAADRAMEAQTGD